MIYQIYRPSKGAVYSIHPEDLQEYKFPTSPTDEQVLSCWAMKLSLGFWMRDGGGTPEIVHLGRSDKFPKYKIFVMMGEINIQKLEDAKLEETK